MQRNYEQECSPQDSLGGPWDACGRAADGRGAGGAGTPGPRGLPRQAAAIVDFALH